MKTFTEWLFKRDRIKDYFNKPMPPPEEFYPAYLSDWINSKSSEYVPRDTWLRIADLQRELWATRGDRDKSEGWETLMGYMKSGNHFAPVGLT